VTEHADTYSEKFVQVVDEDVEVLVAENVELVCAGVMVKLTTVFDETAVLVDKVKLV
jgi:hypothetical protein